MPLSCVAMLISSTLHRILVLAIRNERGAWGLNISGGVETGDFVSIESVNVINLLSSTLGKPSPGDIILVQ
jgi:hypothetical protein